MFFVLASGHVHDTGTAGREDDQSTRLASIRMPERGEEAEMAGWLSKFTRPSHPAPVGARGVENSIGLSATPILGDCSELPSYSGE
jgi:hypothetical protein